MNNNENNKNNTSNNNNNNNDNDNNNTDLKYELLKVWNTEVNKVYIIPIVIGALETVTKNVAKYLEKIDFKPGLDPLQKACVLGTARIIRKVLDYSE